MNEIKLGKKISEGKTVDVYESGDLAVKVFKPDAPKTVVFYEAFMDSKVEETGLNVPKIKEVELIDGKWAIATELIKGKSVEDALKLTNKAVIEALDGLPPVKVHCSVLAEEAVKAAVKDYYDKNGIENDIDSPGCSCASCCGDCGVEHK